MDLSKVRIREHYGLITNDTRTSQFTFVVSPPKNRRSVETQDYVLIDHPHLGEACPILAVIKEITSYEEVSGSTIGDRIGRMLATAEVLGYVDLRKQDRPLLRLLTPPIPGSRVYVPVPLFIEDTLNRNSKGQNFVQPIALGKLEGTLAENEQTTVNCFLDAQELTNRHTLIAAMAGTGKTLVAKRIAQGIACNTRVPTLIVDQAGEYSNLEADKDKVLILAAKPREAEKRAQIKQFQIKGVNDKNEGEAIAQAVRPGQIVILNGQGLTVEERRVFFTNCFKALPKNRTEEAIEPFFLLIDEAENLKGEALDELVTEGRKNGIAICLVSIHPTEFGSKILSQVSNHIVGKILDKSDLEYLAKAAETSVDTLSALKIGEWMVNGVNRPRPLKVQITE